MYDPPCIRQRLVSGACPRCTSPHTIIIPQQPQRLQCHLSLTVVPSGLQAQMQSMGPALQRQRSVRGVDLTALGGEPGLVQRCLGGHAGTQAFTPYLLRPALQVGCCHVWPESTLFFGLTEFYTWRFI